MNYEFSYNKKNIYYLLLLLVVLGAAVLRIYGLDSNPNGLYVDEPALGYNAWCLAHYKVDRYLNEMPIYAQNFSYSGQSPLYTYATALIILISGGELSVWTLRAFGFISSMLVVIFGLKTIEIITENKWKILLGTLFIAICPYAIMHQRFALDCNAMLGFTTIAMYSLLKAVKTQKTRDIVLCGVACGLTLYSYALSYIIMSLFLVASALYLLYIRKLNIKQIVLWAVSTIITALPIILFIVSILFELSTFRFLCFTISPVAAGRASELSFNNFFRNMLMAIKNTLTYDGYMFNAFPRFGTIYYTSIVFFIIGLFKCFGDVFHSIKKRTYHQGMLFLLLYVSVLFTGAINTSPTIYRMNAIFISILYFTLDGINFIIKYAQRYKRVVFVSIFASYALWFFSFSKFYYTNTYHPGFLPLATDAIDYATEFLEYDKIAIEYNSQPEFVLFALPISPYEWGQQREYLNYASYINTNIVVERKCAYIFPSADNYVRQYLDSATLDFMKLDFDSGYTLYFAE